ncbi:hypothetical protein Vi05172_g11269 [Venturia inaequalis]|nr:hypothetical protein Vi05172_g11269 [Venturia inaequalis]
MDLSTAVDATSCEPGSIIYPLCASIYGYAPSLAWNALFLSIFAVSTLAHLAQGVYYRMWTFIIAMCIGGLCEVIGEIGRLALHKDPLSDSGFKLQLAFLTFAPAFLAAGIYLNLKHLVLTFGTSFSRMRPAWYTWFFISCDIFSLALQGAGGAVAAMANPTDPGPGGKNMFDTGNKLMNSGIIVQVVTLVLFGVLSVEFAVRVWRGSHLLSGEAAGLSRSLRLKTFLGALGLAYVVILIRCCYRVAELSGGWGNEIMSDEALFVGLDSTMVAIAMISLNLFHPGSVFGKRTRKGRVAKMASNDPADRSSAIELKGDRLSERFQVEKA